MFHKVRDGKPAHGHHAVFVCVLGAVQVGYHGAAVSGLVEVVEELDVGVRASDKAATGAEVGGHLEGSFSGRASAWAWTTTVASRLVLQVIRHHRMGNRRACASRRT